MAPGGNSIKDYIEKSLHTRSDCSIPVSFINDIPVEKIICDGVVILRNLHAARNVFAMMPLIIVLEDMPSDTFALMGYLDRLPLSLGCFSFLIPGSEG